MRRAIAGRGAGFRCSNDQTESKWRTIYPPSEISESFMSQQVTDITDTAAQCGNNDGAEKPVAAESCEPVQAAIGAPKGNRNRLASGLYAFTNGKWPPGCSYVQRQANVFRHNLRAAVVALDGQTTIYTEAIINSACRHESRVMLLQRWLREASNPKSTRRTVKLPGESIAVTEPTGLGVMERANLLAQISAATESRDRCLKLLRLAEAAKPVNPWDQIHALNSAQARQAIGTCEQVSTPVHQSDDSTGLVGVPGNGGVS